MLDLHDPVQIRRLKAPELTSGPAFQSQSVICNCYDLQLILLIDVILHHLL